METFRYSKGHEIVAPGDIQPKLVGNINRRPNNWITAFNLGGRHRPQHP